MATSPETSPSIIRHLNSDEKQFSLRKNERECYSYAVYNWQLEDLAIDVQLFTGNSSLYIHTAKPTPNEYDYYYFVPIDSSKTLVLRKEQMPPLAASAEGKLYLCVKAHAPSSYSIQVGETGKQMQLLRDNPVMDTAFEGELRHFTFDDFSANSDVDISIALELYSGPLTYVFSKLCSNVAKGTCLVTQQEISEFVSYPSLLRKPVKKGVVHLPVAHKQRDCSNQFACFYAICVY